jgi:cytoskeletal protein CcmA (bactofilin family)
MESLKDPEIIEAGTSQEKITQIDRNLIIKGSVNGPVHVVNGQCYVLGSVQGPVAVVNGSVTVLGTVKDSVSVVSGNIRVAGRIEGSSHVVDGKILKSPEARIEGSTTECSLNGVANFIGNKFGNNNLNITRHYNFNMTPGLNAPPCFFFWKWKIAVAVLGIIFSGLLVLIWPEHFSEKAKELGQNPLRYGAIGIIFWIVFWALFAVALLASILLIGLPFVALLILVMVAVKWYGFTVVFSWIGQLVLRKIRGVESSSLAAVVTGGLLLAGVRLIPFLGFLLIWAVGWLAAGVTVLNLLRQTRSSKGALS